MAAVLQLETGHTIDHDRPVRSTGDRRQARPIASRCSRDAAVYRRRRLLAAALGLGVVLSVARAGAALGGSSPAIPVRHPHVMTIVVEPGDTLWSIARRLAPHSDPRAVVDALVQAHGSSTIVPGETLTWLQS